jgi:glutathione S-transferase
MRLNTGVNASEKEAPQKAVGLTAALPPMNRGAITMKFCYCDESGTGEEPVAVMAGVVVDAQRMHRTKEDWTDLLGILSDIVNRRVPELHTRDFYAGKSMWRTIDGTQRGRIITAICSWLSERKHKLVFSAVDKDRYRQAMVDGLVPDELNTPWRFMGFHLVLGLQKAHQRVPKNKGHTLLVFDNEERERLRFTDLLQRPPDWSDEYYERKMDQAPLDQVVDVPYFADSRDVGLLQMADLAAFFLRRFAELEGGLSKAKYRDEYEKVAAWTEALRERVVDRAALYPAKGRRKAADLFYDLAPETLRG